VHSGSKLSLLSRKIANILLFNSINAKNKEQTIYTIKIGHLAGLINYNSHDYRKLKMSLLMLVKTPIEWNVFDEQVDEQIEWGVSGFLSSAVVKKKGFLEYSYSPHFLQIILNPTKYALVNLDESLQLTSQYSMCLYENCIRYAGVGQTPWWQINDFKRLTGIHDGIYSNFEDLKKRVVDFSLKEINKKCSLKIGVKIQGTPKNPDNISIKFVIEKVSKQFALNLPTKLKNIFKLSQPHVESLLEKFGETRVKEAVDYIINSNSYQSKAIKSLGAYLVSALDNDYKGVVQNQADNLSCTQIVVQEKHVQKNNIDSTKLQHYQKEVIYFVRQNLDVIPITYKDLFAQFVKNTDSHQSFLDKGFNCDEVMHKLIMFYRGQWHTLIPSAFWDFYYEKV